MARQERDTKVVDLLRFRNARVGKPLPLFDAPAERVPVAIAPFRVLSARELSHRTRMLAHLRAAFAPSALRRAKAARRSLRPMPPLD
jgi:hypothetical protein